MVWIVAAWDEYETCRHPVAFSSEERAEQWIAMAEVLGRLIDPACNAGRNGRPERGYGTAYVVERVPVHG